MRDRIIALHGKSGAGKDTFASVIQKIDSEWQVLKFADCIKTIVCNILDINLKELEANKDTLIENYNIGENNSFGKNTIRELMQYMGTDIFRNKLYRDIHIDMLHKKIRDKTIITDLRFKNELQYLKKINAVIIKIEKAYNVKYDSIYEHISETELDSITDWQNKLCNYWDKKDYEANVKEIFSILSKENKWE